MQIDVTAIKMRENSMYILQAYFKQNAPQEIAHAIHTFRCYLALYALVFGPPGRYHVMEGHRLNYSRSSYSSESFDRNRKTF